jgi:hypothetical protein
MTSKHLLRALVMICGLVGLLVACSVGDIDLANKACPCGTSYVCDAARNVCVLQQGLLDGGGLVVGDGGGGSACGGDLCPCSVDTDCKDPDRKYCSPEKVCVECTNTPDSCPSGKYCNYARQCIVGCKQESDCQISPAAPHCDTNRHQCVACRTLTDCAKADQCSPSGECVEGCDTAQGKLCMTGKTCCQGLCLDTKTDALNCGSCGSACSVANGTPKCGGGNCSWTCATGFDHCGSGNTGCETSTRTDATHCGSCARDCNTEVLNANTPQCSVGTCTYATCKAGFGNCDGNAQNGCECVCGSAPGQTCCPGRICNFSGGNCNGANKCI